MVEMDVKVAQDVGLVRATTLPRWPSMEAAETDEANILSRYTNWLVVFHDKTIL